MGGSQSSKGSPSVPIESGKGREGIDVPQGGYRMVFDSQDNNSTSSTNQATTLSPTEEAFMKGKEEGLQSVHRSLGVVASQVYDNVNQQLQELQDKHTAVSQQLATELDKKLAPASTGIKFCLSEKSALATCLQQRKQDPLTCANFADVFSKCAYYTVTTSNTNNA